MRIDKVFLSLVVLFSSRQVVDAGSCKTLLDSDSTLVKSLATAFRDDFSDFPFATVFSDLHDAVPWLSTCVAAIDPVAVYASMLTSSNFRSCLRMIDQTSLENGLWSSEGWEELCPLLQDTAIPCVKTVMVEIVINAISASGGCCDPFLSQVETLFSGSLTMMVEKFAKYAANIVCSKRKITNMDGQTTTELCGYSIYNSLGFIESEDDIVPLLGLLQLPTTEMCEAFAGKLFTLTNGSELTIGFGTKGSTTIGICLEPIDGFLNYVASWPIFSQTWSANDSSFTPSDVFASGKSLSFSIVKKWLNTPTNFPAIVKRTLENFVIAVREVVAPRYSAHYYVDENYTYRYNYSSEGSRFGHGPQFNLSRNPLGESDEDHGSGSGNHDRGMNSYGENYNEDYQSSSNDGRMNLIFVLVERLLLDMDSMLLHIPNGGECTFSSESITFSFDLPKASATETITTASTQSSGAENLRIIFFSSLVTMFMVCMELVL